MAELLLLGCILLTRYVYRKRLKTWLSRIFCLVFASLFILGNAMNLLVIRLNGGKMPVINQDVDWENAPSIELPDFIEEIFHKRLLSGAQKAVLLTDTPHEDVSSDTSDRVRLKFLADIYPIRIQGRSCLYSLGDVFIFIAVMLFLMGIFPVWLLSRRIRKKALSP